MRSNGSRNSNISRPEDLSESSVPIISSGTSCHFMVQFAYIIGREEKSCQRISIFVMHQLKHSVRILYIFGTTLMVILCSLSKFLAHIMTDKFTTAPCELFW
ncbi:hypothetical protein RchiOBHm_Chr3g0473981 [Rosa chinensis]|uniref:Uncharacterized protein n=1 Tax=Rosa chinensis TaxID=74649 RepID=A0A2P6RC01_ROSCH|nr:hypothetical protein RchiOBHm_Chr3g0473981 [Rosa chinensis]